MAEGTTRDAAALQPVALPDGFDLLTLHARRPDRYPFLLETTTADAGMAGHDAWDLLFAFPGQTLCLGPDFRLDGPGTDAGRRTDFLDSLDAWWQAAGPAHELAGQLPFSGGWFLFLGYELALQVEPGLGTAVRTGSWWPGPDSGPIAFATRIPVAIARDRRRQQAWIVAEGSHRGAIDDVLADIGQAVAEAAAPGNPSGSRPLVTLIHEPEPSIFRQSVQEVRRLIANGDVYQVNLARRWSADLRDGVTPAEIYRQLRQANPAPFSGIAAWGDRTLVSSSPERLVRWHEGCVETRPIAGTWPAGTDRDGEQALRRALLDNPKERAEHIMLIDLERNDLGRVCLPGTVAVDEYMVVESYAHVHHIVSNIRGRLRPDVTPGALIRAVFPGGTITGCPKVRCMEIIGRLEPVPRGPYTGSMGYLNLDGSGDLNILIRSFVVQGRQVSFSAGSGIVADSDPQRELDETRAKAKGLLLALGPAAPQSGESR